MDSRQHSTVIGSGLVTLLAAGLLLCLAQPSAAQTPARINPAPTPGPAPAGEAKDAGKEEDNPHLWQPRVTSVAVFKNGLGFFMREGEVKLRDGWCVSKEVPPAAFGTLAIYSHNEKETVDIVGSGPGEVIEFDGIDAPKDVDAKRQRLAAMQELSVQITYKPAGGDAKVAAGKVKSVEGKHVILDARPNDLAVPIGEITKVQLLELPIRAHVQGEGDKAIDKTTLGMAYLRKGITWIPEYTLKIIDDDTAEMTLRGTVVNEAEDLIKADVHFVVGVPHFAHTDFMAPLAVGQVMRTIGSAVAPGIVGTQMLNNAAMYNREMDVITQTVRPADGDIGKIIGGLPKVDGGAGTDYTVYTKKGLTVRRGEKAVVTLFKAKIRYSHVYRWNLPGRIEHNLVLQNSTDTSWTTGPCVIVRGQQPLAEDILKYVPKGAAGEMPVTTAINVAHEKSESEAERKLKVHEPSKEFFLDLVTVKGKLQVKNFEKRAVTVVVTAPVLGKPLEASDNGQITVDTSKLQLMERSGSVQWTLKLEPDETKTVTYTYERYVPSR